MSRRAAVLLVSLAVLFAAGSAQADDHHKDWWGFLKGEWSYEISPVGLKGTATWRMTAKGNALIGRFVQDNGVTSTELSGWRSDTKSLVVSGYGSAGNYWHLDFQKVTPKLLEGPNHGVLPDGRSYKGVATGKRVGDNTYEFHFEGETGDKEELTMMGKFTRKTD